MNLSQIAQSIGQSATLKLNATAAALRAEGQPVIHLGGGEPKSKAPAAAIAATTELLQTGEIRYAPASGIPALKDAILRYTEQHYGRSFERANVIASSGAKQSIMVALHAVVDPGDEVVYPVPYWVSYPPMVSLCGGTPVPVRASDGAFYPTVEELEAAVTPRTKALILNSPNNPSGAMCSEQFIADVVQLCERRSIYLIMDDIYQRLVFDGRRPVNCYEYARETGEKSKLIVVNGVSKQYAMTGFRLGWAVASQQLIRAMTNIQGHQTSGSSILAQQAALAALNGDQSGVDALRATLESNRDLLVERMASIPGVRLSPPDGTFYSFPDFGHYDGDSTRLADFLLKKALVVTVPGIEFGMDGHLRISFCGSADDITTGLDRIRWALDPEAPREIQIGERRAVRDWN